MFYEEWRPEPASAHFVETFWRFEANNLDVPPRFDHQIVPDGLVSIHGSFADDRLVMPLVSGPSTISKTVHLERGACATGFRLRPGIARPLLSVDLDTLRDAILPLGLAVGAHADWLAKALQLLWSREDRNAADAFLAAHMPAGDLLIRAAGDRLLDSWGSTPIAELARMSGLSPRHFRDRFARESGLGPKTFAQVRRQRAAWIALVTGDADSFCDASYMAGYADQSHFARSAREAFGRTPGEVHSYLRTVQHRFDWLNRRSGYGRPTASPMGRSHWNRTGLS